MKLSISPLMVFLCLAAVGCQKAAVAPDSSDVSASVEDAVTSLSAILDDQNGSSYASAFYKPTLQESVSAILLPKAWAASCVRPGLLTCSNGLKSTQFDECDQSNGRVKASGQIDLDYSDAACGLTAVGSSVTRTFSYALTGAQNGELNVTSDSLEDYRGNLIGGGSTLTRVTGGYQLAILGQHKILTRNGRQIRNHSLRTLSPIEVSVGLARDQRVISNGELEVAHNLAGMTAVYRSQNLEWSQTCCYPVSGSMTVEYSGSKEGTATIDFLTCGQAQVQIGDEVKNVEFSYCE